MIKKMVFEKLVKFRSRGKLARANLGMPKSWWGKTIKIITPGLPFIIKKIPNHYSMGLPLEYGERVVKIIEVKNNG